MRKYIVFLLFLFIAVGSMRAEDWTRVTDPAVLRAGDRLLIACPEKARVAADLDSSRGILTATTATFCNNDTIISSAPDALVFTLGGEEGLWTLANAQGQMLGAAGTKDIGWDNYVHTWTITITDGLATIESTSTRYGRLLYNVISPRFTTYTSAVSTTMLLPALYRKSYHEYAFSYQGYPERRTVCAPVTYPEGKNIVLSSGKPMREGYTFIGWFYNDKTYLPGDTFVMPDSDVTLLPVWQKDPSTSLPQTHTTSSATKQLINNTLYIIVGNRTYDLMGNPVQTH